MKTNPFARSILKIRFILLCVAVLGMAGAGWCLGQTLTVRYGQATVVRAGSVQVPNVSFGDAMACLPR